MHRFCKKLQSHRVGQYRQNFPSFFRTIELPKRNGGFAKRCYSGSTTIDPVIAAAETTDSSSNESQYVSIEEFFKANIVVGTVIKCEILPNSKKLCRLQVDLGEKYGTRTILSGVRPYFDRPDEQLVNQKVCVVENLPPRKMMGELSEGMVLFAMDEKDPTAKKMSHVAVADYIPNGTRVM